LKREMTLFRVLKERMGDHPNIVRLLEVYFEEPPFYVVMDHVEGQDLKAWCEQQGGAAKVPLETRLEIVAQIADALQAAHDAGVIHRDVKPGNILVSGVAANWCSPHSSSRIIPPPAPEEKCGGHQSAATLLGSTTHDVFLNDTTGWRNVPERVWDFTIGGYQVLKKWLSYREHDLLGRPLTTDEAREVTHTARRLAALILLQPEVDANYQRVKESRFAWSS